jgi:hypothetical protein
VGRTRDPASTLHRHHRIIPGLRLIFISKFFSKSLPNLSEIPLLTTCSSCVDSLTSGTISQGPMDQDSKGRPRLFRIFSGSGNESFQGTINRIKTGGLSNHVSKINVSVTGTPQGQTRNTLRNKTLAGVWPPTSEPQV